MTTPAQQRLLEAALQVEAYLRDELDLVADGFCEACCGVSAAPGEDVEHEIDCPYVVLRRAIDAVEREQLKEQGKAA